MAVSGCGGARHEMLRRNGEADTIQEAGDTVEPAGMPGGIWSMQTGRHHGRNTATPADRYIKASFSYRNRCRCRGSCVTDRSFTST